MKNYRIESLILAAGLLLLGVCVYFGLNAFAEKERVVSVRGLAEKEVEADHVIWPIVYKTTGNDLSLLYADINKTGEKITTFLQARGIDKQEISLSAPKIVDLRADRYQNVSLSGRDRYNVTLTVTVSTGKVKEVIRLMSQMGELLKQGVAISGEEYGSTVRFEFKGLNAIKPAMIEEATRNARAAADKFAADSDSKLGKIKNAQQGLFSIEDRDQYTPHIKKVRVVTSVDFYLGS